MEGGLGGIETLGSQFSAHQMSTMPIRMPCFGDIEINIAPQIIIAICDWIRFRCDLDETFWWRLSFFLVIRWVKNEDGGWWNDRQKTRTRSYAACVFTTAFDSVCIRICFTTPSLCVLCLAEQSTSQAVDGVVWDPAIYHNSFRHVSHFHGDIWLQHVPQVFNVCTTRCLADWPSLQLDNIFHVIWWIWMKFCLFQSLSLSKYRISITFCKSVRISGASSSRQRAGKGRSRSSWADDGSEVQGAGAGKSGLEVRVGMLQWSDDLSTQFHRSTWTDCVEFFSRLDIEQWSDFEVLYKLYERAILASRILWSHHLL